MRQWFLQAPSRLGFAFRDAEAITEPLPRMRHGAWLSFASRWGAILSLGVAGPLAASTAHGEPNLPTTSAWTQWLSILLLEEYNTRIVVLGTTLLGFASGTVGTFLLMRKRALMGDVLSHAMLPGIALAYVVMVAAGGSGKALTGLLVGATLFGLLGVGCVLALRAMTRLKEDAALGIVLSVFFGFGVAVLGIVQKLPTGSAAGLESFIYGKTASMIARDATMILATAIVVSLVCVALFKSFSVLCFDQDFAATGGSRVLGLDIVLMCLVLAVTVVGLQAVGLMLIVALLIIPPAAARFWTQRLPPMVAMAALFGGVSGWLGSSLSASARNLPAGAIIVVVGSTIFGISMFFGASRGVVWRTLHQFNLRRTVSHQHLLRALYEWYETHADSPGSPGVPRRTLEEARTWSPRQFDRVLRFAARRGFVRSTSAATFTLTESGLTEASRVVRNHRLWEIYMITHADIAASHVDRDADHVEHALGEAMVAKLERLLAERATVMPRSPHALAESSPAEGGPTP